MRKKQVAFYLSEDEHNDFKKVAEAEESSVNKILGSYARQCIKSFKKKQGAGK